MRRYLWIVAVQVVALAACATAHAQSTFPNKLPTGCTNNQIAVYQTATNTWVCGSGAGTGDVTASGTLANNAVALGGGTTVVKTTTTGTGVVTAIGINTNSAGGFVTSPVPVANGGTGLTAGTSGGVPTYTASGTITSSGALTANLPVIGGGAGAVVAVGTRSGNTTAFVTTTGTQTSGDCVKIDASGNHIANGSACGTGTPGGSDTQVQFNDSSSFGGDAGLVFNKTLNTLTSTGAGTFAGLNLTYASFTGSHTVAVTDGTMECLTNACTFTLPTAVGIQGRIYSLKNLQTANALTIATTSSQTVDGASPGTISNGCLDLQSDNANWRIIGSCGLPLASLTSGGVIYASSTTSVASSALLAANALVLGGGAGTAPATAAGLTTDGSAKLILGVNTTTIGTVKMFGNTSGDFTLTPTAVAGTASVGTLPARSGVIAMETGSAFTTGTIILPFHFIFTPAVCQNATASLAFSTPTTLGAAAACVSTTAASGDPAYASGTFVLGGANTEAHGNFPLPSDWSGAVDVNLKWNSLSNASGDVVWLLEFGCTATGEVPTSISFNSITFTATANQTGTTAAWNVSSKTGITTTGCAANEQAFFIVHRDTDTSGDTLDQDVQLLSVDFVYRRTITIGG